MAITCPYCNEGTLEVTFSVYPSIPLTEVSPSGDYDFEEFDSNTHCYDISFDYCEVRCCYIDCSGPQEMNMEEVAALLYVDEDDEEYEKPFDPNEQPINQATLSLEEDIVE